MASVLFSVVTLSLVALIARSDGIPMVPAVLLTVGCYGFAYTGAIARGFALAQMLSVAGGRRAARRGTPREPDAGGRCASRRGDICKLSGGIHGMRGAVARCRCVWSVIARSEATPGPSSGACAQSPWWCAAGWRLLRFARNDSGRGPGRFRSLGYSQPVVLSCSTAKPLPAQFAPFEAVSAVARLAQYAAATLFGGLPLYVAGTLRKRPSPRHWLLLLLALIALIARRARHIATPETRVLLAMTAAAPPIGLLLLGFAFDNAPIELRYLAFATPYIGLLLAATLPRAYPSCRSGHSGHRAARPDDPPGDDAAGACNGDRGCVARQRRRRTAAARQ